MHAMINCECGRKFENGEDIRRHRKAVHSRKCPQCTRKFTTPEGLEQHRRDIHHWGCGHCNERFPSLKALNGHKRSAGHCYCRSCNQLFGSPNELHHHQKAPGHVDQFRCCECNRDFVNETALEQHLSDKKKHTIRPREKGYVCGKCNRKFQSNSALKQHEISLAHVAISDLKCIEAHCNKHFKSPSSLLHHLESGTCVSKMDRGKLDSIICAYDTDHIISGQSLAFPTIELGSELSDSSSDYEVIYTPDSPLSTDSLSISHLALPDDISLQLEDAVERSSKIRCCECSKTFKSTGSLDQHRNSAAHAKPVYHCPTNLSGGTHAFGFIQTFKTLSGLAQHLEAKACVGGASTLREVAAYIEGRLQQIGWKTRILLQDSQ